MNGFGRLTRYLWLVSSIFFITTIFGYLYYLETVRKEDYFNQLYFRKLSEISSGFESNLARLLNFARSANKHSSAISAAQNDLERVLAEQAAEKDTTEKRDPNYKLNLALNRV